LDGGLDFLVLELGSNPSVRIGVLFYSDSTCLVEVCSLDYRKDIPVMAYVVASVGCLGAAASLEVS